MTSNVIQMGDTPAAARRSQVRLNAMKCRISGLSKADKQRILVALSQHMLQDKEALATTPGLRGLCVRAIAKCGNASAAEGSADA